MGWLNKWRSKREVARHLASLNRSEVFDWIYETNKWGGSSRSGKGSDPDQTFRIRQHLPALLNELQVQSILDIPCGDHNWMGTLDLGDCDYIGADIVPQLIEQNRLNYPHRRFEVIDVCRGPLPEADLVISRDLLVHLSFADIDAALTNLLHVEGRYFMCTTFPEERQNRDGLTGKHRRLNMCLPPFGWPEPRHAFEEGSELRPLNAKWQGVWELATLRRLRRD